MRALEAIASFFSYTGSMFPGWQPGYNERIGGLQLSHVISKDKGIFTLNSETRVHESSELSNQLKVAMQNIPQFTHHNDTESVISSWKSSFNTMSGTQISPRENPNEWRVTNKVVPDITDKQTVLTLAKLAANAYVPTPHQGDWSEVNSTTPDGWNHDDEGYGWDEDGIRGYVFTSVDKKTMVLSIKGTSTAVLDNGGPTAPNDKINDNLFFSCCCARISRMWSTVCDCYLGNNQCDEACLEQELLREDRYYREILEVYANAKAQVPTASTIWITGHSLGGALASMLGRTYGIPVVTFEAPGEDLAVRRLHLPVPPGVPPWEEYVWHFGHNTDPIYMGTCTGSGSTCWIKGFAMETKCHSGKVCIYDSKKDLGWHESIVNHRIHVVIDNILEVYDEPAICLTPGPCEDCESWDFIDPLELPEPEPEPKPTASYTTSSTSKSFPTKTTTTTSTATDSPGPTSTDELTSSCVSRAWYGMCETWTTYPVEPTPTNK